MSLGTFAPAPNSSMHLTTSPGINSSAPHGTLSGPASPTSYTTYSGMNHSTPHSHGQSGVYLPNLWVGENNYRHTQNSTSNNPATATNNDLYMFPGVRSTATGNVQTRPSSGRWKGDRASGFSPSGTPSGGLFSQLNGLNGFSPVNNVNGGISHVSGTPSPASGHIFTNSEDKELPGQFYDTYDRYDRRDSRELSPLGRDLFRTSSSVDHGGHYGHSHSQGTHAGLSSSANATSNNANNYAHPTQHVYSHSGPSSGQNPPSVDGYVPPRLRPAPPRLAPVLNHSGVGYDNYMGSHYGSWPSIPLPPSTFFVPPDLHGSSQNNINQSGLGLYRQDEYQAWTPTPPPLASSAPAPETDETMAGARQTRRAVSAPSAVSFPTRKY